MSNRGAGVSFMAISAFLISAKYITAAIFGSNMEGWQASMFNVALNSTGNSLIYASIASFSIGLIYLVRAEFIDNTNKKKRMDKRT